VNSFEHEEDAPPPLALDQFLKLCGVVGTGGQAKQLIQGGGVMVNGEVETRRRKKLALGDRVEVAGEIFEVDLQEEDLTE
jgi:ribosome-associated protein